MVVQVINSSTVKPTVDCLKSNELALPINLRIIPKGFNLNGGEKSNLSWYLCLNTDLKGLWKYLGRRMMIFQILLRLVLKTSCISQQQVILNTHSFNGAVKTAFVIWNESRSSQQRVYSCQTFLHQRR